MEEGPTEIPGWGWVYRPTEILTRIAADNSSDDIMDIIRRILDEMNERAKRWKKHDFEYGGLCIDIQNIHSMFSFANIVGKRKPKM